MARTRSGADLIDDAYLRADLVGATDRHPRDTVLRYVNQGCVRVYGLLIEARGKAYYALKPAPVLTTLTGTTRYALSTASPSAASLLHLTGVRYSGPGGFTLDPFTAQDEPMLREPGVTSSKPTHYELQPGYIELLPTHAAGLSIVLDMIPSFTDLEDSSTSTFDGINGWEEYGSAYAATRMLDRDDEQAQAAKCEAFMSGLAIEIAKLASKRDAFRAERVKNVRGGPWLRGRYG